MKLSEFFNFLTYGELSNLTVGGKEVGGIYPKHSDEVVSYIRQGLTDLHSRFPLRFNEVILQQRDNISMYELRKEFSVTGVGDTGNPVYVMDSVDNPYEEDLLQIQEVYDEEGNEVFQNNEMEEATIFTPQFNVVQILKPEYENALSIIYKADHKPFNLSANHPRDINIDIPQSLIRPLALYVSSLAHAAVGSTEGQQTALNKMQEYTAAVIEAELLGTVAKAEWTNQRVEINGWV